MVSLDTAAAAATIKRKYSETTSNIYGSKQEMLLSWSTEIRCINTAEHEAIHPNQDLLMLNLRMKLHDQSNLVKEGDIVEDKSTPRDQ